MSKVNKYVYHIIFEISIIGTFLMGINILVTVGPNVAVNDKTIMIRWTCLILLSIILLIIYNLINKRLYPVRELLKSGIKNKTKKGCLWWQRLK